MSMAERATDAALEVLHDRRGFDWWWVDLDEVIQADIREAIMDAIERVIDG